MLRIEKLSQAYGGSQILWDVDLTLEPGDCVCLMGRNGVGKTTLLKALMGLLPLRSGKILFDGLDLTRLAAPMRARNGIGYVPQGRDIFPRMTVEENLRVGLVGRRDGLRAVPSFIFELFPVLKDMLGRQGGDLSGGQQQQLAIGRALACDPKLMILDEPTEGIQPNIISHICDVISRLNREMGLTVLWVEQKLPIARRLGKTFQLMDKGRIVASGAMAELDDELINKHLKV
ncbi:urea ABC transporter, ATP-binding protein UrtE [Solidesulfovibrio fructosivorans JJ]]|uniref:Urea ABC transporter, ATP-binding protein UrtE n=1 Tax=Solidesulfovibrio fructosivorans JJ] TaxID=596151 RepID=E1JTE0_SOLFR|nr:urea ABC transporter ATP-binding subunit UrtE [Solidesulfovibrio fructosivorans]EFL52400.1 urea ABC transporter, ATP-binding protein UrtE [Solidesulfovibrio fructosivorans JJ]]